MDGYRHASPHFHAADLVPGLSPVLDRHFRLPQPYTGNTYASGTLLDAPVLPYPSETESIGSSTLGQILSSYEHSSTLLALGSPQTETRGSLTETVQPTVGAEGLQLHESGGRVQHHSRNDSASSNVSLASMLSCNQSNQQRFLRYAMRTQDDGPAHTHSRWLMDNVLQWLDSNGFNELWKDTFRKNELSNMRFLELGNYEPDLHLWQQFSTRLEDNDNNAQVVRFVQLLRAKLEDATGPATHALADYDASSKAEHRKSSSTLWAQPAPASAPKPRPDLYIDPRTAKPRDQGHKFFRKHMRAASSDSSKDALPLRGGSKPADAAKKSNIFSTLRKYGGEKAAGIVKQVHSTQSPRRSLALFSRRDAAKKTCPGPELRAADEVRLELKPKPAPPIDQKYFPVSLEFLDPKRRVLLTRDGRVYMCASFTPEDMADVNAFKRAARTLLDMLDMGTITFHLIDFSCDPGEALPDEVLAVVLRQDFLLKLQVSQDVLALGTARTFSRTSSGTSSFVSGGTVGQNYPATPPQYMLQETSRDVDYLSVKERREERDELPHGVPMKHSMAHIKRAQLQSAGVPGIGVRQSSSAEKAVGDPVPYIPMSGRKKDAAGAAVEPNRGLFSVVRKDRKEIDFDKRRQMAAGGRPRMVASVLLLSSSGDNADTERAGSKPKSAVGLPAAELKDGEAFVARRKAPPPPTRSSSMLLKKRSMGSLVHLPASTNEHSRSSDSLDSARSSQMHSARYQQMPRVEPEAVFDFDDAPKLDLTCLDDEEFFARPLPKAATMPGDHMDVRPPVEELYDNLEKYFPHSVLDKPIIDALPASPCTLNKPDPVTGTTRGTGISRTFSNANKSLVSLPADGEDEVFYGDGAGDLRFLKGRMKTIRAVANEARNKRLESIRGTRARNGWLGVKTADKTQPSLLRANIKLWGLKTVEVTPDQIEKGYVGRITKYGGGQAEFAWVKGELVGRGSYGAVYLALNVSNGEMLAVKQVTRAPVLAADALIKEVQTMKDLDHLNIVQYLGFEQKHHTYSLFLEYVGGGSVLSCLKSHGKFDQLLVRFITRQVLEGLKYLHGNGILHRDLKADNLLLDLDGTCKISDFGISKKSQDIYSNNAELSMQGTIFWMAPEVIHSMVEEKKQGYSAKVDIWSLGCVVLEMFAGQRPWSNEAVISAIYKIGKTKLAPPIPADIGADARDFLDRCFTINSAQRPTASELLAHKFMGSDGGFEFRRTRLHEMIKFNSRKNVRSS
ncbi:Pkinase-domain-containing protein [Metschnikowia bicuspidata]|uniref:Pkinase-domain-containing protein n=1 Tax=Metschnikowia bicuspidata TaxID=27322 RepID=A0A4P9ZHY0_9ASCO|nr:Pkinase-domain-containing protein [Metschnikowia bicuspidata]